MINQRSKVMSVISFPRSAFQAGHQTVLSIQADMGFVAVEILHLLFFFAIFGLDFALVLDPPASVWISRSFSFILALLIFVRVHIRYTVHAVHDLDRAKLDPALQRHSSNPMLDQTAAPRLPRHLYTAGLASA